MSSTVSRTVRFTKEELRNIEAFLKKNPFFDFSSLTRLAISEFLRNPRLKMHPLHGKNLEASINARSDEAGG